MEVREKMRPILQAFVEPIATLPYGNLFCPQKSCPPSTRTRTVGMHAPSYSSNVLCVRKMEDSPRIQHTDTVRMTLRTTWYSSTPLRSSRCPSRGPWRTLGLSSCTNRPQHRVSTSLWPRTWWAGSPLFPCFWRVTRRQRSLTCSASARIRAFRTVALTLLLQTEGGAAMSTRLTPGCGSLGAASPAWVV